MREDKCDKMTSGVNSPSGSIRSEVLQRSNVGPHDNASKGLQGSFLYQFLSMVSDVDGLDIYGTDIRVESAVAKQPACEYGQGRRPSVRHVDERPTHWDARNKTDRKIITSP